MVHIDRDGTQLERRQQRFDPLGAVVRVHPDVVAFADTAFRERVRESVGAVFELAIGNATVSRDQRLAVGYEVGGELEHVGEVEGGSHRAAFGSPRPRSAMMPRRISLEPP